MEIFQLTLRQMMMMFFLIAVGYVLQKKKLIPQETHTILSKLEAFVFIPALNLHTQITQCTVETFTGNASLIGLGLIAMTCFVALSYPLSMLFVPDASTPEKVYQRKIYQYAMTFSNYGFMGNFIILGVWGSEVFYQYGLFHIVKGILCASWGLYILIPKEHNAGMWVNLRKGMFSPQMVALMAGMAIGLLGLSAYVPPFLLSAFESASKCMGPVAMLLAGMVIGGYDWKEVFFNPKVFVASFVRLVALPAAAVLALKAIGADQTLQIIALIGFGMPMGLNTIVYPSAYGGDTKTGASMAMISHTLSVVTIPLMYLLLIEMM